MYPDVHFLWGKLVIVREVLVTTKDRQALQKLTFFSLNLLHEVGAQSLVVDLEVVFKPSQTFMKQIHIPKATR
jgi:hypothetical protein